MKPETNKFTLDNFADRLEQLEISINQMNVLISDVDEYFMWNLEEKNKNYFLSEHERVRIKSSIALHIFLDITKQIKDLQTDIQNIQNIQGIIQNIEKIRNIKKEKKDGKKGII